MFTHKQSKAFRDSILATVRNGEGQAPTVFLREGDKKSTVLVSAEDGKSFADFYGEFRGGYPWIHPSLEKWANDMGQEMGRKFYWDWENAGCLILCE